MEESQQSIEHRLVAEDVLAEPADRQNPSTACHASRVQASASRLRSWPERTSLPGRLRGRALRRELGAAVAECRPQRAARALASWRLPVAGPTGGSARAAELDAAVARGDRQAVRHGARRHGCCQRPGPPDAFRRAAAVDVEARGACSAASGNRNRRSPGTCGTSCRAPCRPLPPTRRGPWGRDCRCRRAPGRRPRAAADRRERSPGSMPTRSRRSTSRRTPPDGFAAIHVASRPRSRPLSTVAKKVRTAPSSTSTAPTASCWTCPRRPRRPRRRGRRGRGAARRMAGGGRAALTTIDAGRCSGTAAPRRSAASPRRSPIGLASRTCSPHRRRPRSTAGSTSPPRRCVHVPHPMSDWRSASPDTLRRLGAGWTWRRATRARFWWA